MAELLTENELRRRANRALHDRLGSVEALRFLALICREPFDYQKWRSEYFARYDLDQLLDEARKEKTPDNS